MIFAGSFPIAILAASKQTRKANTGIKYRREDAVVGECMINTRESMTFRWRRVYVQTDRDFLIVSTTFSDVAKIQTAKSLPLLGKLSIVGNGIALTRDNRGNNSYIKGESGLSAVKAG